MKNIKRYIILLIIFIIIILIALIFLLRKVDQTEEPENEFEQGFEFSEEIDVTYKQTTSISDFFRVKDIIERYYNNIAQMNGKVEEIIEYEVEGEEYSNESFDPQTYYKQEQETAQNALYYMLGEEYIQDFGITIENIKPKLAQHESIEIIIENMYTFSNSVNINSYLATVQEIKEETTNISSVLITIDSEHQTFSIYLADYIEKYGINQYKIGQSVNREIKEIKDRKYNKTIHENIGENDIAKYYYDTYKKMLANKEELLYAKLNQEYKEKRFGNLENFKTYVNNNKEKLQKRNIIQYGREQQGEQIQYVCIDQNNNAILFHVTSPTQYTIILDTYTIDLPEFTEKYEVAKDEEKVLMNIQKFFEAINNSDYQYAYNKLDATFKANNFATVQDFENYVKTNFFENNKLSAGNPEKQDDIYLYEIKISDATEKNTNSITKTFVMQLKEGTDFVMSFSVQ